MNERTRLLLINYPNKPTGCMLTRSETDFIHDLLLRYGELYVLSDEVYERLAFGREPHISMASYEDVADRVVTVNGFSKAYMMTGWRIGYLHARGAVFTTARCCSRST